MRRTIYWYVGALAFLGVTLVGAMYFRDDAISRASTQASLWFGGLVLLGNVASYGRRPGGAETVAYLPTLAAITTSPTWFTVLVAGAVTAVVELPADRDSIKKLFNFAKALLSSALAVLVYRAVGGIGLADLPTPPGFLVSLPAFAAAAMAALLSNTVPFAIVVALSSDRRFRDVWKSIVLSGLGTDLSAAPLAYVFGRVYLAFGGAGVAWLALPLVGLRQLYSSNWQLKRTNEELLELMVAAIEARDPYTSGHSRRVAQYSRAIATGIGLAPKKIDEIERAALLHDVGKIDEKYAPLLRKTSRLTAEEEAIMQTHAARSAELVAKVSYLNSLVPLVRHHHEAWDGTGYPDQLAGERIPLASRIIAFADTIDAMTSERPYRAGLPPEVVRAELVRCRGGQFDPSLTDQVISGAIWNALFPSTAPRQEPQGLTLIRTSARRLG